MLNLADVDQNRIEEVDVIVHGGNYGGNVMESDRCLLCDEAIELNMLGHREGAVARVVAALKQDSASSSKAGAA